VTGQGSTGQVAIPESRSDVRDPATLISVSTADANTLDPLMVRRAHHERGIDCPALP